MKNYCISLQNQAPLIWSIFFIVFLILFIPKRELFANDSAPEIHLNTTNDAILGIFYSTPPVLNNEKFHWQIERVMQNTIRLKNVSSNTYLHNQNGPLVAGNIQAGWWSAMWITEKTDDGHIRLKNRWKETYIHNERGKVELGPIDPNWWSARWLLEDVGGGKVMIKNKWKNTALFVENGQVKEGKPSNTNIPQQNPLDKLTVERYSLWGRRNIDVCWENPTATTPEKRRWVQDAVKNSWSAYAQVDFTGWGPCQGNTNGIRILIKDDANDGPHVKKLGNGLAGMKNGMLLNMDYNNWGKGWKDKVGVENSIKMIAVHEFGHALGIAHEHNRSDCGCWKEPQGTTGNWNVTPCDAQSVMNYCQGDENFGYLSYHDIDGIQRVYGKRTPPAASKEKAKIVVKNNGAFIARFKIEWTVPGFLATFEQSKDLAVTNSQTFEIPANAIVKVTAQMLGAQWYDIETVSYISFDKAEQIKTYSAEGSLIKAWVNKNDNVRTAQYKLTLKNDGFVVAKFQVTCIDSKGLPEVLNTGDLPIGKSKEFWIDSDKKIQVTSQFHTMFEWKTIKSTALKTMGAHRTLTVTGNAFNVNMTGGW